MTELDTVKRAKMYMEKLAMGIDPLTDKPIPVGEVATAPRMRKCFQYVAGLLEQIADNGGIVGEDRKGNIPPIWTAEVLAKYVFPDVPLTMTEIVKQLNAVAGMSFYTKLSYRNVVQWLVTIGALEIVERSDGKHTHVPTEQGITLGIQTQNRVGRNGRVYSNVVYNEEAQRFLLDNMETILTFANAIHLEGKSEPEDGDDVE